MGCLTGMGNQYIPGTLHGRKTVAVSMCLSWVLIFLVLLGREGVIRGQLSTPHATPTLSAEATCRAPATGAPGRGVGMTLTPWPYTSGSCNRALFVSSKHRNWLISSRFLLTVLSWACHKNRLMCGPFFVDSSCLENILLLGPRAALRSCHLVLMVDVHGVTESLPILERDQN